MFERFTKAARSAVVEAQQQARHLGHHEVVPEHLLLGLLADDAGLVARTLTDLGLDRAALEEDVAALGRADEDALRSIGVDLAAIRDRVEAAFGPGALDRRHRRGPWPLGRRGTRGGTGHLRFTRPAKDALEQSLRQALSLHHGYIGAEHLLLGLIADDAAPTSRTLSRLGLSPHLVRRRVIEEIGSPTRH